MAVVTVVFAGNRMGDHFADDIALAVFALAVVFVSAGVPRLVAWWRARRSQLAPEPILDRDRPIGADPDGPSHPGEQWSRKLLAGVAVAVAVVLVANVVAVTVAFSSRSIADAGATTLAEGSAVGGATGVAVAPDGVVYVAAPFSSSSSPVFTSLGVVLRAYGPDRSLRWEHPLPLNTSISGRGPVIAADDGGVTVAGYRSVFGATPETAGAFVGRYDHDGRELWTRWFGAREIESVTGVAVRRDRIVVAGALTTALAGQTSAGEQDVFVRAYDLAGSEAWTRQFGSPKSDDIGGIAVTSDDGVVVAFTAYGPLSPALAAGTYLRAFDRDGTERWTTALGAAYVQVHAAAAGVDGGTTYLVATGAGTDPGTEQDFIAAVDASGQLRWRRPAPRDAPDLRAVATTSDGQVFAAGCHAGTFASIPVHPIAIDVVRVDDHGDEAWHTSIPDPDDLCVDALAVSRDAILVGAHRSNVHDTTAALLLELRRPAP